MLRRFGRLSLRPLHTPARCMHTVKLEGVADTPECRYVYYDESGRKHSPWHQIPLFSNTTSTRSPRSVESDDWEQDDFIFNFVNEIPRGTRAKMEIAVKEEFNPIKQDMKKGALRFYPTASLVNYGCLPQTWEDPNDVDVNTGRGGDDDPIDVCEIGSKVAAIGEVYPVKVLGILGMIDEGETDWKVIAIATDDPLASELHDLSDVEKHPKVSHIVKDVHDWFRDYKVPDGKPPATFAFDGKAQPRHFARDIIHQTHESWKQLIDNNVAGPIELWTGHPPNVEH